MPDWIQVNGDPVSTGSHGDTDYTYANGDPVPNTGVSNIVFEDGVGLGGVGFDVYNNWPNGSVSLGANPRLRLKHDGSFGEGSVEDTGAFGSAVSKDPLPSPHFFVEFKDVSFGANSPRNNWTLGAATSSQARPFNDADGYSFAYIYREDEDTESGATRGDDEFRIVANDSQVDVVAFPPVDWSTDHTIRIEYDGTARLYIDGSLTTSSPNAQDASYRVGIELEDDAGNLNAGIVDSSPENATVGAVDFGDL